MNNLNNLRILLVEDETGLHREMAAFLELYSACVMVAADGREALEMFSRQPVDLVISDIRMPVLDGLGLAEKLKELSPETPVILCTAFTETHYLLIAIELNVAGLVRKPLDMDELLTKIHKATAHIVQQHEIESLSSELTASISDIQAPLSRSIWPLCPSSWWRVNFSGIPAGIHRCDQIPNRVGGNRPGLHPFSG